MEVATANAILTVCAISLKGRPCGFEGCSEPIRDVGCY